MRQWFVWADLAQAGDHCPFRIHGADVTQRMARCARGGDAVTQVIAPGGQRRQKVVMRQRLSPSRYQAFDRNIRYLGRIPGKARENQQFARHIVAGEVNAWVRLAVATLDGAL